MAIIAADVDATGLLVTRALRGPVRSPDRPDISMRIEAAAYRGKPVYFGLIGPWTHPGRMQPYQQTVAEQVGGVIAHCFDAFDAGGRRAIRSTEPAPGPGRSSWSGTYRSFCFCGVGVGLVLWRASHL